MLLLSWTFLFSNFDNSMRQLIITGSIDATLYNLRPIFSTPRRKPLVLKWDFKIYYWFFFLLCLLRLSPFSFISKVLDHLQPPPLVDAFEVSITVCVLFFYILSWPENILPPTHIEIEHTNLHLFTHYRAFRMHKCIPRWPLRLYGKVWLNLLFIQKMHSLPPVFSFLCTGGLLSRLMKLSNTTVICDFHWTPQPLLKFDLWLKMPAQSWSVVLRYAVGSCPAELSDRRCSTRSVFDIILLLIHFLWGTRLHFETGCAWLISCSLLTHLMHLV